MTIIIDHRGYIHLLCSKRNKKKEENDKKERKTRRMIVRKFSINIWVLFLTLFILACQPTGKEVAKQMASFDRVFIPVFYATYNQSPTDLPLQLHQLEASWKDLEKVCRQHLKDKADWKYSVDIIEQWLGEASIALKSQNWKEGYNKLDHIRYEMMQIRECNGIPYYLDKVWNLQLAFELVQEAANDPMLCQLSWQEFRGLVNGMNRQWEMLNNNESDKFPFYFDRQARAQWKEVSINMTKQLVALEKQMDCAAQDEIATICAKIEPVIYRLLFIFGNENPERSQNAYVFPAYTNRF